MIQFHITDDLTPEIQKRTVNTRHNCGIHVPNANLTSYQKDVYCAGMKLASDVPSNINILNHGIQVLMDNVLAPTSQKYAYY